jgi:hypothetical protein
VKKKTLSLIFALALALPFGAAIASFSVPEEAKAATSQYIPLNATATIADNGLYLLGVPTQENGTNYVSLLSCPYSGTVETLKVPCLASDDATSPYAIATSDFLSSAMGAFWMAYHGADAYCLDFGTTIVGLSYGTDTALSTSDSTDTTLVFTPVLNTSSIATKLTVNGLQATTSSDNVVTFSHYTGTSADSGATTEFLLYALPEDVAHLKTAIGFAQGLTAGVFASETDIVSLYRALPWSQREIFGTKQGSYTTTAASTQAVEKIISDSQSTYRSLNNNVGNYTAATPTGISVDYTRQAFVGFDPLEEYMFSYTDTSSVGAGRIVVASGGSFPLVGNADNVSYNCYGKSVTWKIYSYSQTLQSESGLEVAVDANSAAPTSVDVSLQQVSLLPDLQVAGVYSDEIDIVPQSGYDYLLVASASTLVSPFDPNSYTWSSTNKEFTGAFTSESTSGGNALAASTAYTIYTRKLSTTTSNSDIMKDSNGNYLGYSVTTLSDLEGQKLHFKANAYTAYLASLTSSSDVKVTANRLAMLKTIESKINAVTVMDNLATYTEDRITPAFAFAATQDSLTATLNNDVALQSSDSDYIASLLKAEQDAIAAISYFDGGSTDGVSSDITRVVAEVGYARYRESTCKSLVDFFNTSILPTLQKYSDDQQKAVWDVLDAQFAKVISPESATGDNPNGTVDTLYNAAKEALLAALEALQNG